MRQGKWMGAGMVAAGMTAMLLVFAGAAQARPAVGTPLSVQTEALTSAVGTEEHQLTAAVASAPVVGHIVRTASSDAAPIVSSVPRDAAPIVGTVHATTAPIVGALNGDAARTVASVHPSTAPILDVGRRGLGHTMGGITRQGMQATSGTSHQLAATVTDGGTMLTHQTAQLAKVGSTELTGLSASAGAGAGSLIGGSTSLYTGLVRTIQATLASVPVLPRVVAQGLDLVGQVLDLVGQVRIFIGSEVAALASQLAHDGSGQLSQVVPLPPDPTPSRQDPTPLLQDLPATAIGANGGPVARFPGVSVPTPTPGQLPAFRAASVGTSGAHLDWMARLGSAAPGLDAQSFAFGASSRRAAALVTGGLPWAFEVPGGHGAIGFSGTLNAGAGLPLVLLLFTLLIPVSWRLRLAVARYRPVIFAFPLERPG